MSYHTAKKIWRVQWRENGKNKSKGFSVSRYFTEGLSFADASRLAQEAAVRHRKALEQTGKCGFELFDLAADVDMPESSKLVAGVDGLVALEENGDMLKKMRTDVTYERGQKRWKVGLFDLAAGVDRPEASKLVTDDDKPKALGEGGE